MARTTIYERWMEEGFGTPAPETKKSPEPDPETTKDDLKDSPPQPDGDQKGTFGD